MLYSCTHMATVGVKELTCACSTRSMDLRCRWIAQAAILDDRSFALVIIQHCCAADRVAQIIVVIAYRQRSAVCRLRSAIDP